MKKSIMALVTALLLLTQTLSAAELSASDLDKRRKALNDLLNEQWEWGLKNQPEFASMLGDKRYNDQLSDVSEAKQLADVEVERKFLKRFEAISPAGFSDQEALNRELMIRNLRDDIEDVKFRNWQMPVNQFLGIHLFAAQFPSLLTFQTAKDYDDYVKRLNQFEKPFNDTIANMRKGMKGGQMPPKFLLEKVAAQAEGIAKQDAEKTPFALPLGKMPASLSDAEKERIRGAVLDAIRTHVLPAYTRFATFVRDEYAPKGRTQPGLWSIPGGAARYANAVKRLTTTDMTPEEIHQLGLREVTRIEGEMLHIAQKMGYSDLKSFNAAIEKMPELRPKSRDEILDTYRKYEDQMYAKLPELFGRLPKAKLEVVAIPAFREKTAAGADYNTGAPDGSRPGRINVNTSDPESRKTISFESTAYHEGVPGHHMQLSIAQEITSLPNFRRHGGYTAFVEGWALYSERLGKEVGFYQNPYSDYGRLQDEMLRAIRLVVDTGVHSKKWTREQMVQFFHDHSAIDEVDLQAETDRYIAWPGQALAYKIGQLTILRLRDKAQRELGAKFDIKAFHDEVLGAGALPMQSLENRIDGWIAAQK